MRYLSFACFVFCAVAVFGKSLYTDDFLRQEAKWNVTVHDKLVSVEFGAKGRNFTGLLVKGDHKEKIDTAWSIRSKKIYLPEKRKSFFMLSFDVAPDVELGYTSEQGVQWQNVIFWYDSNANALGRFSLPFTTPAGDFRTVRIAGSVPDDADSFEIQIGFDGPNLWGGSSVAYKNLRFELTDTLKDTKAPIVRGDFWPPRVRMTSPSPTTDSAMRPAFTVTDETAVDWSKFKITVDGKESTHRFKRAGSQFVWNDVANWSKGIHKIDVDVSDTLGNSYVSKKRFLIGEPPRTSRIALRDDGMTLINGKPFFPIGLYGVMRREFNDNDFNKAFVGLKEGGFNTAHSYAESRDPSFLQESEKHGFLLWMETRLPGRQFAEKEMHYPHVLAWYLGDDTSGHEKPWELLDYDEATKAVDPTRITCQADGVRSAAEISAYRDYVEGTDVFMPEIYPLVLDTPEENRECVARVIRDMKRIRSDIKESGVSAPRGIWPIIQYFKGWGWKHFPTREELFAMTYAAICHGANGMTWYAYNGTVRPEKNQYNYGVTSTPERWRNICELSSELKKLAPVLLERTPSRQPQALVVKGPKTDPLGFSSISFLLKKKGSASFLIAVNSSDRPITAVFDFSKSLPAASVAVNVFGEKRTMPFKGKLQLPFDGFGVSVLKIK